MAEDRLTIEPLSIFDNSNDRQVEFAAEASGERYRFAIQYDALEALAATVPDDDAPALFRQHLATIERAGAAALARDPDQDLIVVSENDLAGEQGDVAS